MSEHRKYRIGTDIDLDKEVVLGPDGQRITEERAQQIAEDAVARVRRGRPSLTGEQAKSPRVQFRVPPELADEVEAIATERGLSVSQVVRDALAGYVESSRSRPSTTETERSNPRTRSTVTKGMRNRSAVSGRISKQVRRLTADVDKQARKAASRAVRRRKGQ